MEPMNINQIKAVEPAMWLWIVQVDAMAPQLSRYCFVREKTENYLIVTTILDSGMRDAEQLGRNTSLDIKYLYWRDYGVTWFAYMHKADACNETISKLDLLQRISTLRFQNEGFNEYYNAALLDLEHMLKTDI